MVRWASDALVFISAVWAFSLWQTRGHARGDLPAWSRLRTLDGAPADLRPYRGKPTLVAVWAPWCGVCKSQSQNVSWVQRLVSSHAGVVSVASAFRDVTEVRHYVTAQNVDYPVLLGDDALTAALGVSAFPTVFFLDSDGHIRRSVVGYTTTVGLLMRLWF